ncbi:two-component system sensor histidine kinase PmrB [Neisseria sp. Ec49-e6-T10]|uniref:two-component system sensor histidine kinase PmrB n=1 Tax=Neisseria sp. Ec49-e6-T10 TaxID=3140744 RepID=UPI003EC0AA6C
MSSLRQKLLLSIGMILLCTQVISSIWVWYESQEQITILVNETLEAHVKNDQIQHEIEETIAALLVPSLLTISLSLLIIFWTITRLTKPLNKLTREIESRSINNLQPIQTDYSSLEVSTITQKLNLLLQQLEQGMENERRFTADVAHELRTPLAGIRLNLELLDHQQSDEITLMINRIDQMMVSVEQLLQLSRAGQQLLTDKAKLVDLVQEVIIPMQTELTTLIDNFEHPIIWQYPEQQIMIKGDSGLLFLLLRNLLDNVSHYARHSTQTIVRLSEDNHQVTLEVLDQGPGIPKEKLDQVTQRFVRIDETTKGHGLGLNIVARIAQTHQAQLIIENRQDCSGLRVAVIFKKA